MLTDLRVIDQNEYASLLQFSIKSKGNLLVFGQAGVGKTEMAKQAVEASGLKFKYVNLSVLEAPDLLGLPVIDRSGAHPKVEYAAPSFLPRADETKDRYVILFDELDKAKEELQNPLLECLQSFSINGNDLAIHSIIATGNLPDEHAFSKPVNHALTNRCQVFKLQATTDAWLSWANSAGVNFLVNGFIGQNIDWLSKPAPEGDPTAYCRPSPRSWAWAAEDLDVAMAEKDTDNVDFLTMIVSGRVGSAAALKFKVWLDHYRHIAPEIDKLVTTGKHPGQMSMDRLFVASISAMEAVRKTSQNKKKDENDTDHLKRVHAVARNVCPWIASLSKEFQIAALKSVISPEILSKFRLVEVKEFVDISRVLHNALRGF